GTKVAHYFGADGTGKTISEAFAPLGEAAASAIRDIHRKTALERKPIYVRGETAWLAGGFDCFDSLYLPLSDDGETVNMILSAFTFDYTTVKAKSESVLI